VRKYAVIYSEKRGESPASWSSPRGLLGVFWGTSGLWRPEWPTSQPDTGRVRCTC